MKNITIEEINKLITISKIQYQSTHSKLCVPIINRIYKKMKAGIRFAEIKVEGNIICDGHHRYIASLLANYNLELISWPLQSEVIIIGIQLVLKKLIGIMKMIF